MKKLIIIAGLFFTIHAHAQKVDSLQSMRQFVTVCNSYKQLPLQASITIKNKSNFITDKEDTITSHASFYLQKEGCFIQLDGMEQLVNDSLMLLVNRDIKRMMLYPNNGNTNSLMQQMTGMFLQDSSLQKIAEKYKAYPVQRRNNSSVIEMTSRKTLYKTTVAKETISLTYSAENYPVEIKQTKRMLMPIDSATYANLVKEPSIKEKLLVIEGEYVLIKENITMFTYNTIEHKEMNLPANIADRIVKNKSNEFVPIKKFNEFILTQNL